MKKTRGRKSIDTLPLTVWFIYFQVLRNEDRNNNTIVTNNNTSCATNNNAPHKICPTNNNIIRTSNCAATNSVKSEQLYDGASWQDLEELSSLLGIKSAEEKNDPITGESNLDPATINSGQKCPLDLTSTTASVAGGPPCSNLNERPSMAEGHGNEDLSVDVDVLRNEHAVRDTGDEVNEADNDIDMEIKDLLDESVQTSLQYPLGGARRPLSLALAASDLGKEQQLIFLSDEVLQ
jgi:hypothetical protein